MPWENQQFYQEYLAQTYFYVQYSTRLLALSAGYSHPTDKALFRRSLAHIKEENNHEVLADRDLQTMGTSIQNFSENIATKLFYQHQMYQMPTQPKTLLGYIICLEELAVTGLKQALPRMIKAHGEKACQFLIVHSEEDM